MAGGNSASSRVVLEYLLWQLDQSFDGKPEHSLMANLSSVTGADLDKLPPGGGRTMRDLIVHCGSVKAMYVNHAFGDATRTFWTAWDQGGLINEASFEDLMDWLERTHGDLINQVHLLATDAELASLRPTYWGGAVGNPRDPRRDQHPRCLPRRRNQPPPRPAAPIRAGPPLSLRNLSVADGCARAG